MHVEFLGSGTPEYAIVAGVHGDETCGWHAYNQLKSSDLSLRQPLKFVLANERAFHQGVRYCEADLNRVMPGDPTSDVYEERLAAALYEELEGMKVLDFHDTESRSCPFAIITGNSATSLALARSTGLDQVVDMSYMEGGVTQSVEGVVVECGYHDDVEAATLAYDILRNFLAAEGLIEADFTRSDPSVFRVVGEEPGRGFQFTAENFRRVEPGEVFARKEDAQRRAEEPFYPVLMSTNGYESRIGFKAQRVETPVPRR